MADSVDASSSNYRACMLLSAAGDAIGYNHGRWEFCQSTTRIHMEVAEMTGGKGVRAINANGWRVSDDTVEHLATAEGLVAAFSRRSRTLDSFLTEIARCTKRSGEDFTARAPGKSEQRGIKLLQPDGRNWRDKPWDPGAVGCGAAMRTACIGLAFPQESQLGTLVAVAIEASRLTKTHPDGYLGGLCAALFTSYALRGLPPVTWGRRLLEEGLPEARRYVLDEGGRHIAENLAALEDCNFEMKWREHLARREILDASADSVPVYPEDFGEAAARDRSYAVFVSGKNPGSTGIDSVLIAYDALLWAESLDLAAPQRWEQLCLSAVLHRGDNDSTGSIALAWYGALHAFDGVPAQHYRSVEYAARAEKAGIALHAAASEEAVLEVADLPPTLRERHSKKG